MGKIDYYKLYLRNFYGSYEDAKRYKTEEKLLQAIDIYFNDYEGCLIIARDNQNNEDIIIGSRVFNNEKVKKEKQTSLVNDNTINNKTTKNQETKVKQSKTNQGKRLVRIKK